MQRQPVPPTEESVDLREYLDVLKRRAPVVVVTTLVALALAVGYSLRQTSLYTGRAEVLVQPTTDLGSSSVRLDQVISLETEARLLTSAPIAEAAKNLLDSNLSVSQLLKHVSVQTTPDAYVLDVSFWAESRVDAANGANAFAKSYLEYRKNHADDMIAQERTQIETEMTELRKQVRTQNELLESSPDGSIEQRNAQDTLDRINVQLAVLASRLADVSPVLDPGEIILPATPPQGPSSPNIPVNVAVGLFVGLFSGVLLAFILDRSDDRVRKRSDLQVYTFSPVLAYVPHLKGRHRERASQLVVDLEPRSSASEAYRTIRTNILSMASKRSIKVVAVVSAMQGEGKSLTAANLAAALGQADQRILIVSVDIRKPTIHSYLRLSNGPGLSEVLEGNLPLEEAVLPTDVSNVWILPAGQTPANPAELLQPAAMSALLAAAKRPYDLVILDCPPVLGLADCLAVVPLADAVLLVVRAEKTRGGAILEAYDELERVGVTVDAVIMTDVRVPRGRPGHAGYGYYGASRPSRWQEQSRWMEAAAARRRPEPPMPEESEPPVDDADATTNGQPHLDGKPLEQTPEPSDPFAAVRSSGDA